MPVALYIKITVFKYRMLQFVRTVPSGNRFDTLQTFFQETGNWLAAIQKQTPSHKQEENLYL